MPEDRRDSAAIRITSAPDPGLANPHEIRVCVESTRLGEVACDLAYENIKG